MGAVTDSVVISEQSALSGCGVPSNSLLVYGVLRRPAFALQFVADSIVTKKAFGQRMFQQSNHATPRDDDTARYCAIVLETTQMRLC